jgi:hypothetical protein
MSFKTLLTIAGLTLGVIAFNNQASAQVVVTGGYAYSPGVVTTSYYAPAYAPASSLSYYSSPAYYSTPYASGYYTAPYYTSGYYSPYAYGSYYPYYGPSVNVGVRPRFWRY